VPLENRLQDVLTLEAGRLAQHHHGNHLQVLSLQRIESKIPQTLRLNKFPLF
jgi:hypothetical protein